MDVISNPRKAPLSVVISGQLSKRPAGIAVNLVLENKLLAVTNFVWFLNKFAGSVTREVEENTELNEMTSGQLSNNPAGIAVIPAAW